jgi:hypothetical protein
VIVGLFIRGVALLVGAFLSLLPSWTPPSWLAAGTALPTGVATSIGGLLHAVVGFLPIDTVLTVLQDIFLLWPVIVAYLVFKWVWAHIPTIAGFGTGDGG